MIKTIGNHPSGSPQFAVDAVLKEICKKGRHIHVIFASKKHVRSQKMPSKNSLPNLL